MRTGFRKEAIDGHSGFLWWNSNRTTGVDWWPDAFKHIDVFELETVVGCDLRFREVNPEERDFKS